MHRLFAKLFKCMHAFVFIILLQHFNDIVVKKAMSSFLCTVFYGLELLDQLLSWICCLNTAFSAASSSLLMLVMFLVLTIRKGVTPTQERPRSVEQE